MLRMAELCAGYSGLYLAMRSAGWPVELAWYAENDPDACKVLAAHHPDVANVGDITSAQFSAQEPVDVVAAGWPCQGNSVAGKRLGSADERHLWPEMARAVRVLRPSVFVGENVPGLLTIERGQLFGQVLADLDDLGYTARWTTVGACRVGLCHHRHRVFIVATFAGWAGPDRWPVARRTGLGWEVAGDTLFGAGLAPQWPAAGVVSGGTVWAEPVVTCGADGIVLPTPTATPYGNNQSDSPGAAVRPSLEGVVQMLPTPGARLGDDRGAPDAELAAARLESGRRNLDDAVASLLPTPTAVHHARNATARRSAPRPTTNTNGWTLHDVAYADRWRQYAPAVRRHELVTGVPAPEPTELGTKGQPRLDPRFPEWMLTLPAGWVTDHLPRGAALRVIGNGIATLGGAYALRLLAAGLPITGEQLEVG